MVSYEHCHPTSIPRNRIGVRVHLIWLYRAANISTLTPILTKHDHEKYLGERSRRELDARHVSLPVSVFALADVRSAIIDVASRSLSPEANAASIMIAGMLPLCVSAVRKICACTAKLTKIPEIVPAQIREAASR